MTTPEFRIISQIFGLLAEFSADELAEAAKRNDLSPQVRAALRSLAREARLSEKGQGGKKSKSSKSAAVVSASPQARKPGGQYQKRMIEFLNDKRRFPTKSDMVRFLKMAGLEVPIRAKDSRALIARRVVSAAEKSSDFRKVLNGAVYRSGNGETRGWLDLISGHN